VSALQAISLMIFEVATTQFSLTICESTGVECADESMSPLESVSVMISLSAATFFLEYF
jgi:hypothetical protein